MTGIEEIDWRDILLALERRLEALTASGVNWLSVPADPALMAILEQAVPPPAAGPGTAEKPSAQPVPTRRAAQQAPEAPAPTEPPGPAARPPQPITETSPAVPSAVPSVASPVESNGPSSEPSSEPSSVAPSEAPQKPPSEPPSEPPHPSKIQTLESLRFQYRDCLQCALGKTRNRLVFGAGSGKPRVLFIGEGPGAEEDQQGLPFVGRAGSLLTGLIEAMGLVREDVYITNVVKCRPPGNRNPAPDEVASCGQILDRQIELLDPDLIVTLGNVPLKALNPSAAGITRERGRIFKFRQWRVLPTFHPSYLLRKPGDIGLCWNDFRQAVKAAYPEEAEG